MSSLALILIYADIFPLVFTGLFKYGVAHYEPAARNTDIKVPVRPAVAFHNAEPVLEIDDDADPLLLEYDEPEPES